MDQRDPTEAELKNLKFLRILVTVLTASMILGVLTVVALLVIRLQSPPLSEIALPDEITLPDGQTAISVTYGSDWYGVVTESDEFLIFDQTSGELRQTISISTN